MPAFLLLLPFVISGPTWVTDGHTPGVLQSKAEARNLECTQLAEAEAHQRYPGIVTAPVPRGSFIKTRALVCRSRLFELGERPGRDEAILSRLREASIEVAAAADAPELEKATWLVEAFYPDPAVAAKLSFATKVELVGRGKRVSDRVPVLAAGDVLVLARMPPTQAYPLACARYHAEGSMAEDEVLLGLTLLDGRETVVHAGLCARGQWRWVR